MQHSKIAFAAHMGASGGIAGDLSAENFESLARRAPRLLDYLRQHQFPPAETLARHHAALDGKRFPWPSLRDAPEQIQAYYLTFRAVAEALNPFHQPDQENARESQEATQHAAGEGAAAQGTAVSAPPGAEAAGAGELVEITICTTAGDGPHVTAVLIDGQRQTAAQSRIEYRSNVDEEWFTAILPRAAFQPSERAREPMTSQPDDVASRTKAGQEAMDAAIAESGGTFSAPKPAAQEKPAEDATAEAAEPKKKAGKAK
jgi:hypothetical protein